jgi:hypothetical protein
MTREIKEIEDMLQLWLDMDSPSMVISVATIEKHFPSPRLAIDPSKPCYNLGKLKKWATLKGWSISFATTPTKDGKKILPAIKFTPLSKINTVPDSKQNPASNPSDQIHDPWQKPLGKIAIGIIIAVLSAVSIWAMNHYLSINLHNIK